MNRANQRYKLILGVLAFILALIFNVEFSLPMVAVVALVAVTALFLSLDDLVCYVMCLVPFTWFTPGYMVLILYIILLLKTRSFRMMQILPTLMLIFLEFAHLSLYDFTIEWPQVLSFCSFLALFFYLLFYQPAKDVSPSRYVKMFCFGLAISLSLSSYILTKFYDIELLLSGALRSGVIDELETGLEEVNVLNANSAAYFAITLLACLLVGYKRLNMNKCLHICLLIVAIASGLLSFSRTWIIVCVLMFALYFIYEKAQNKLYLGLLLLVGLAVAISYGWIDMIMSTFMGRFELDNMETAGSRTVYFSVFNDFWTSQFGYVIFGTGVTFYKLVTNIPFSIHNSIQQIYVCQGLLGLSIYIWAAFYYKKHFCSSGNSFVYYIPFIAVLAFSLSLQFLLPQFLMFPLVGAVYVMRMRE